MADKTLTQRLREQDWPEAADRIDALEAACRRAESVLMSIDDDRSTTAHIDARGILRKALGESHDEDR